MTTEQQAAQQKLVEQFEHSAKRSEELAAHARQLGATLKASENSLSKQDLEDWRGHALTTATLIRLFATWLEIDIEETNKFFAQQIVTQQIKDKTNG